MTGCRFARPAALATKGAAGGNDIPFEVDDNAVVKWSFKIDTTLEGGSDGFPITGKDMIVAIEEQRAEWGMASKTVVWVSSLETEALETYSYDHATHGLLTTEWTASKQ